jgi:hypothetical protein
MRGRFPGWRDGPPRGFWGRNFYVSTSTGVFTQNNVTGTAQDLSHVVLPSLRGGFFPFVHLALTPLFLFRPQVGRQDHAEVLVFSQGAYRGGLGHRQPIDYRSDVLLANLLYPRQSLDSKREIIRDLSEDYSLIKMPGSGFSPMLFREDAGRSSTTARRKTEPSRRCEEDQTILWTRPAASRTASYPRFQTLGPNYYKSFVANHTKTSHHI